MWKLPTEVPLQFSGPGLLHCHGLRAVLRGALGAVGDAVTVGVEVVTVLDLAVLGPEVILIVRAVSVGVDGTDGGRRALEVAIASGDRNLARSRLSPQCLSPQA